VRTVDKNCTESKFFKIQEACSGPPTIASYGIDPVFKRGTELFNPDFDDINQEQVQIFYNCSTLEDPTYNITMGDNITVNRQTDTVSFCAELYSSQNLPYAFHHKNLTGKVSVVVGGYWCAAG
jgi:hypothetical protein